MKVFISYSRADAKETANVIHDYLTKYGPHEVFIDTSNIPYGGDWNEVIQKEISICDIFIIIVTPSALFRSEVEKEVELAKKLKKKIIPCIAKDYVAEEEIKWGLNRYQGFFYDRDSKLAMDLHMMIKRSSKIKSYEKNIPSDKDTNGNFQTISKDIDDYAKTDPTNPSKLDAGGLQENKDISQTSEDKEQSKNSIKDIAEHSIKKGKPKSIDKDNNIPILGINRKIIIIPIIAVAIIGLVGSISYFGLFSDKIPPTIVGTFPADGMQGIPINASVYADFSKLMDSSTINPSTFTLKKNGKAIIFGKITLTSNGTSAILNPFIDLEPATKYTATITKEVKDVAGDTMTTDKTWSFTTGEAPPRVLNTKPVDGALGVLPLDLIVSALFSEPMSSTTINTNTFTVKSADSPTPIRGTVSLSSDGKTATFDPVEDFSPHTKYVATIGTGAKDLAANALVSVKQWSFETATTETAEGRSPPISPPDSSGGDFLPVLPPDSSG